MEKKYDNPDVQKFIYKVPFKIEKDSKTDKSKIIVEYLNKIQVIILKKYMQ